MHIYNSVQEVSLVWRLFKKLSLTSMLYNRVCELKRTTDGFCFFVRVPFFKVVALASRWQSVRFPYI